MFCLLVDPPPTEPLNLPVVTLNRKLHVNVNPDLTLTVSDPERGFSYTTDRVVFSLSVHKKIGEKGYGSGHLNSPHGFCLGFDEEIVVADSSNHRIQIFEKSGCFKCGFGIAGRHEGYLWYPRKVAVLLKFGLYVVCDRGYDRSRLQLFTKDGKFLKKITIPYIDIISGMCITDKGQIALVDSCTPTAFIIGIDESLRTIDCSAFMEEPSDIAAIGNIFYICDYKNHNIVVINDDGVFLNKFGEQFLTFFPNGIDISPAGDVLVIDSHGNYIHIVVFTKYGSFIAEYRCAKIKVSRCCGLKITSEGRLATVDKNYHHVIILQKLHIPPVVPAVI